MFEMFRLEFAVQYFKKTVPNKRCFEKKFMQIYLLNIVVSEVASE